MTHEKRCKPTEKKMGLEATVKQRGQENFGSWKTDGQVYNQLS